MYINEYRVENVYVLYTNAHITLNSHPSRERESEEKKT